MFPQRLDISQILYSKAHSLNDRPSQALQMWVLEETCRLAVRKYFERIGPLRTRLKIGAQDGMNCSWMCSVEGDGGRMVPEKKTCYGPSVGLSQYLATLVQI